MGLLPPSATPQEAAAEEAMSRLGAADGDGVVGALWDPDRCPAPLLDHLRWALQAPGHWPADDAGRREALRSAVRLHRLRGTRAALDQSLLDAGVVADVEENPGGVRHTVAIAVRNSGALDAELASVAGVRALAHSTGRISVAYQVSISDGATLSLGHAAGAAALALARLTLEIDDAPRRGSGSAAGGSLLPPPPGGGG